MSHDLRALLGPDGVARCADLHGRVHRHTVEGWVAAGRLLRPHPGVVVLPECMDQWRTRALAAVHGTGGVLSHVSALTVRRLARGTDPVHVSIRAERRALRRPGLSVHRVQRLTADRIGPYPVTDLPRSLVDAWGLAFSRPRRLSPVEAARPC
jgi:hypothetical protein